jgi:hypothetical protein
VDTPEESRSDSDISALLDAWESPTVPPPFDLENFARENAGHETRRSAPSDRPTDPGPEDPSSSTTRLRTRPPVTSSSDDMHALRSELADKFFEGDYAGALVLAEELVAMRPGDTSTKDFADECRRILDKESERRIGSLARVPVMAMSMRDLSSLSIDHRAGFLLSRVDGELSVEALLDICGMQRTEALSIVADLVKRRVIRLVDPR